MNTDWSNLARIVYRRTYARNDNGHLETWNDTVRRVIDGNVRKYRGTPLLEQNEEDRLQYFLSNRKAGPAGRGWWFSGSPKHESLGGAALVNCWCFTADDWNNFVTAEDMLMLGGGVGMNVEHRFVSKLPKVRKDVNIVHKNTKDADFIVPDSREGWCELVRRTLESYFVTGRSFSYSTICVRGYGEKIEGFGGTASGPLYLCQCVEKLSNVLNARGGHHVRPIDAADMLCIIGEMVVSGNVRRSALLILGDPFDREYLRAKRFDLGVVPPYRAFANFSVVCDDVDDLHPSFWKTYESGEPFGIVNRKNIKQYGRMGEKKPDSAVGVNPCFAGWTLIRTRQGNYSIEHLVGKSAEVWDGTRWVMIDNFRVTAEDQKVIDIRIGPRGFEVITVTPYHTFILNDGTRIHARNLLPGMKLQISTVPLYSGDSFDNRESKSTVYAVEDNERTLDKVYCCTVPGSHSIALTCGIQVGQCGEACLEGHESCNLQEIALPHIANQREFNEAARLMHRWGKRVAMEHYHQPKVQEVVSRNHRIGTGITGCLRSPLFSEDALDEAYAAIQKENTAYSKALGIGQSIRTTVVKPSGTISKQFDMEGYEGIHPAFSRYMIQRIRFGANDPLIPVLRTAGHIVEPEIRFDGSRNQNTLVVDFYQKAPDNYPVADEEWDTWKQLDVLKFAQKHWADQAVSVTVYYKKEDIQKIKDWLRDNLQYIKTISFLCHSDHGFLQAPKEAITKERYEELSSKVNPIPEDDIQAGELEGTECEGGTCPVK